MPLNKSKAETAEARKLKRKYGWIKPKRKRAKTKK